FILLRGDQLVELVETMKKGAVIPLVLAVLTQLGKYYAQSWAYHFTFASVNEKMGPKETLPLVFGTFFMNTIAPSLNMAGATLVVDDARRRGIPGGKATSAALLMQMTIESGFMTIMVVGFIILQVTGNLSPAWFLTGLVVVVMVGFMGGIMFIGRKSPKMLVGLLHPVERLVNRILKKFNKNPLDPWAEKAVASFGDAAGTIAANPKTAAKAFGCSIAASTCELAAFCLVGVAFNITNPEALICGYVIATLLP
ncbi:MAG: lysylphosphatidylglycerol synthase domain-containing protein, partial [Eggerthellaceae bacterium]